MIPFFNSPKHLAVWSQTTNFRAAAPLDKTFSQKVDPHTLLRFLITLFWYFSFSFLTKQYFRSSDVNLFLSPLQGSEWQHPHAVIKGAVHSTP